MSYRLVEKTAIVLYDNLPESCRHIHNNLLDLTEFQCRGGSLQMFYTVTKDVSSCLAQLGAQGYHWAVVIAAGTYIQDKNIVLQTIEFAQSQNSPLCGHILDQGGYYHLHPQWFALDLQVYRQVGLPRLEPTAGSQTIAARQTVRSPQNVHDSYTPLWLKASDGFVNYTSDQGYFAIELISALINAEHLITNIPTEIRQKKLYSYPEHHTDEITQMIRQPGWMPQNTTGPLWWFGDAMRRSTQGLANGYYPLNTEKLYFSNDLLGKKLDKFVGVCGGIKPVCILGQPYFSKDTKVCLFDISPAAVAWQQHLRSSWDGNFGTFHQVFDQFQRLHPDYDPKHYNHMTIEQNIGWLLEENCITQSDFSHYWTKYQNMTVKFELLDMLDKRSHAWLVNHVNQCQYGCYIWLSNLYDMDWLNFYHSATVVNENRRELINGLKQCNKPFVLEDCGRISVHGNFVAVDNH